SAARVNTANLSAVSAAQVKAARLSPVSAARIKAVKPSAVTTVQHNHTKKQPYHSTLVQISSLVFLNLIPTTIIKKQGDF
nr:hypothetical protein [Tanacetum cinerariifolium]